VAACFLGQDPPRGVQVDQNLFAVAVQQPCAGHVDVVVGDAFGPCRVDDPDTQGAALALEDAVVLTAELAGRPDDPTAALTRYDIARRERTQRLVQISDRVGRLAGMRNPVAAWLRDNLAALIPPALFLRATDGAVSWTPPTPQLTGGSS
jgi:2-polyprenyl-6-methoxyphenol hydroxylase-like FAD-dependent oxidoreductase